MSGTSRRRRGAPTIPELSVKPARGPAAKKTKRAAEKPTLSNVIATGAALMEVGVPEPEDHMFDNMQGRAKGAILICL